MAQRPHTSRPVPAPEWKARLWDFPLERFLSRSATDGFEAGLAGEPRETMDSSRPQPADGGPARISPGGSSWTTGLRRRTWTLRWL